MPPAVLAADDAAQDDWKREKCSRYSYGWSEAVRRRGVEGLGRVFLDRHEAFIAGGCSSKGDVCPRSAAEIDMANVMIIVAMNACMASTFPPFACPHDYS